MTTESITTHIVTNEKDQLEAVEYIEAKMRRAFGCDPPATEGIICIARLNGATFNGKIVASLVLQGAKHDQQFSLEKHYDFDPTRTPLPFAREYILQATRWTSSHQLASLMTIHTCAKLARDVGKEYMLMEAKLPAVERIREIGMRCEVISGAQLNLDGAVAQVGEKGMAYYLSDPVPKLYMLPVETMIRACEEKIRQVNDL